MNKQWKKFNALGSEIIIVANLREDQASLLDQAERIVIDFEKRFSRFVAESELSRFNDFAGGEIELSETMRQLLVAAKDFNLLTGGIFDPTIIGGLEAIGYNRRFDELNQAAVLRPSANSAQIRQQFFHRPRLDQLSISGNKTIKPAGFRLDLGGIGKGYIVDFLSHGLFGGIVDCWISAGGDLAVKGSDQNMTGWKIGVQDPHTPEREIFSVWTKGNDCGIATSGIHKRRGGQGDTLWHHLIDPRTGIPVVNNILAVTVISPSAEQADVFAKTVLILGESKGLEFIERQDGSAAIIFFNDGGMTFSKQALNYIKRE
jgi:thiamine biosynthesis lipoprotein